MKIKAVALSCLAGVIVLSMGYQHSRAQTEADKPPLKAGVVNIRKIFSDCARTKRHEKEIRDEEAEVNAKLNKLQKDIAAAEAGLDTLRRESIDYLKLARDVSRERDSYESQKTYYEQLLALKDRQWTKTLYRDVLRVTRELAKEKGLDLVFERNEPDFSMIGAAELLVTIQTHKLLYADADRCPDITLDVIARLDEEESKVKSPSVK